MFLLSCVCIVVVFVLFDVVCVIWCQVYQVKAILRVPADEDNWDRLRELRDEIVQIAQGIRTSTLDTAEEIADLATAIGNGHDPIHSIPFNSVGDGVLWIPAGSLLLLDKDLFSYIKCTVHHEKRRAYLSEHIRKLQPGTEIKVLTRPLYHRKLAPPADYFLKYLANTELSLAACGKRAKPQPAEGTQAVLDHMLLTLWDALFLDDCIRWTKQKVTNLTVGYTLVLTKYFLMGLEVGKEPLFTGLCAMCANLLYGSASGHGISNCKAGHPIDKDGVALHTDSGCPDIEAQPPCFLRFSPQLFAKEVPYVFEHDSATNRLRLKNIDGGYPWFAEKPGHWLYCVDCYDRYISRSERSHVPFRDKASQHFVRPTWNMRKHNHEAEVLGTSGPVYDMNTECPVVDIPDGDAALVVDAPVFDQVSCESDNDNAGTPVLEGSNSMCVLPIGAEINDSVDADVLPVMDLPTVPLIERPSVDEYQGKWSHKLEQHSRGNDDAFGAENLCPMPRPQLWQDAPHVAFDELKSADSQGRLALCRPISSLQQSTTINGLERYAHISGDVLHGFMIIVYLWLLNISVYAGIFSSPSCLSSCKHYGVCRLLIGLVFVMVAMCLFLFYLLCFD